MLKELCSSTNDFVRYQAIQELARFDDILLTPFYIDKLSDRICAKTALQALRKLSGQKFGFSIDDGPALKGAAIERWQTWWNGERKRLAADTIEGEIVIIDAEHGLAVVNLGSDSGLRPEHALTVVRDGAPVGRLKIERIESRRSVASVLDGERDTEIRAGDHVRASLPLDEAGTLR